MRNDCLFVNNSIENTEGYCFKDKSKMYSVKNEASLISTYLMEIKIAKLLKLLQKHYFCVAI